MNDSEAVMKLILHGGNARSLAMEAIAHAKRGEIAAARTALSEAAEELHHAHQLQTSLIQAEASGEKTEITMLLIHAQDHLMNAMTVKDLAVEFVDLYERMRASKGVEA
ncbi:PTS lactose/cellobiose transporter subunit IIA [Brevibacillus humidisoli]|uniref:PTS lactose/cellobiose transporter subunit IIA n=1 Tax=Brevibacillus humidisoli TaxID=2895522 RepID=UPI001E649DF9|nr:PTS lactose/cellobiose transporter subunit IIA [Brevibacillus humidisoli]UFJ41602.1 PTS lactose/cellobiose transporter subunit IIA [Brevibacillus humidisoli]